jgi:hypothetical protein
LQYSTHASASASVPVPMLSTMYGSIFASRHQATNLRAVSGPAPCGPEQRALVRSELVAFLATPCEIRPALALVLRADAVLPVVGAHVVPAGPADERDADLVAQDLDHVLAEAVRSQEVFRRRRVALLRARLARGIGEVGARRGENAAYASM